MTGQTCRSRIPLANLDVCDLVVHKKATGYGNGLLIYLHSDDGAGRPDTMGKEFQAALGTTAQFNCSGSSLEADLIEEPS